MAVVVADASAIAAVVFVEDDADAVAERMEGADLVAPTLLPYEVANVAAVKLRRRLITTLDARVQRIFRASRP